MTYRKYLSLTICSILSFAILIGCQQKKPGQPLADPVPKQETFVGGTQTGSVSPGSVTTGSSLPTGTGTAAGASTTDYMPGQPNGQAPPPVGTLNSGTGNEVPVLRSEPGTVPPGGVTKADPSSDRQNTDQSDNSGALNQNTIAQGSGNTDMQNVGQTEPGKISPSSYTDSDNKDGNQNVLPTSGELEHQKKDPDSKIDENNTETVLPPDPDSGSPSPDKFPENFGGYANKDKADETHANSSQKEVAGLSSNTDGKSKDFTNVSSHLSKSDKGQNTDSNENDLSQAATDDKIKDKSSAESTESSQASDKTPDTADLSTKNFDDLPKLPKTNEVSEPQNKKKADKTDQNDQQKNSGEKESAPIKNDDQTKDSSQDADRHDSDSGGDPARESDPNASNEKENSSEPVEQDETESTISGARYCPVSNDIVRTSAIHTVDKKQSGTDTNRNRVETPIQTLKVYGTDSASIRFQIKVE